MYSKLPENKNINITPVKAFKDNYIWLLQEGSKAVIVDPGEAKPVLNVLKSNNL